MIASPVSRIVRFVATARNKSSTMIASTAAHRVVGMQASLNLPNRSVGASKQCVRRGRVGRNASLSLRTRSYGGNGNGNGSGKGDGNEKDEKDRALLSFDEGKPPTSKSALRSAPGLTKQAQSQLQLKRGVRSRAGNPHLWMPSHTCPHKRIQTQGFVLLGLKLRINWVRL